MNWNLLLTVYALFVFISGTIFAFVLIYNLVSGKYRRLGELRKEFSEFEKEAERRRKSILNKENEDEKSNS